MLSKQTRALGILGVVRISSSNDSRYPSDLTLYLFSHSFIRCSKIQHLAPKAIHAAIPKYLAFAAAQRPTSRPQIEVGKGPYSNAFPYSFQSSLSNVKVAGVQQNQLVYNKTIDYPFREEEIDFDPLHRRITPTCTHMQTNTHACTYKHTRTHTNTQTYIHVTHARSWVILARYHTTHLHKSGKHKWQVGQDILHLLHDVFVMPATIMTEYHPRST